MDDGRVGRGEKARNGAGSDVGKERGNGAGWTMEEQTERGSKAGGRKEKWVTIGKAVFDE